MPTTLAEQTTASLERCAVCKIDLKGRIVFLNDQLEELFGAGLEELFGRKLAEFLDEPSQEVLHNVMLNRNHTESAYDATRMILSPVKGQPMSVVAIMSLNFIAGNPVNYQIIISRTAADAAAVPAAGEEEAPHHEPQTENSLLGHLMSLESDDHLAHVVRAIGEMVGAEFAALYRINGESLETVFPSDPKTGSPRFQTLPLTNELHKDVLRTGENYDCTQAPAAKKAIELIGEAPREFVTRLDDILDSGFVIRLAFKDGCSNEDVSAAIEQVCRIIGLVRHLSGHEVELPVLPEPVAETARVETTVAPEPKGQPTAPNPAELLLDLFERFNLGVAIADQTGSELALNTVVSELFGGGRVPIDRSELIDAVRSCNKHVDFDAMLDLSTNAERAETSEILTPGGRPCELLVAGSLLGAGSEVWLFKPLSVTGPATGMPHPAAQPEHDLSRVASDNNFWSNVVGVISALSSTIRGHGEWLAHSFYNQFGPQGNEHLQSLNDHTRMLADLAVEIAELDRLLGSSCEADEVDLSLLCDEAAKRLTEQFPHRTFEFEIASLPKCRLPLAWLKLMLDNIMMDTVHRTLGELVAIKVTAEISESSCCLIIDDNSDLSPGESHAGGFRIDPSTGDLSDLASSDRWRTELPIARYLVERLEGVLDRTFEPDRGLTTTLMLPVEKSSDVEQ